MLKLFYAPNACSLAPHIALNEAGADYEAVKVDTANGEQRVDGLSGGQSQGAGAGAGHRSRHPHRSAGAAGLHRPHFPKADLAPIDGFDFFQMQSFNTYLASHHPHHLRPSLPPRALCRQRRRQGRHAGQGAEEPDRPVAAGRGPAVRRARLGAWAQYSVRIPISMSSPAGSSGTASAASRPCPGSPPTAPGCRRAMPCLRPWNRKA